MSEEMVTVLMRGLERCIITIGAILIAYLGYKLFLHGITKGRGELTAKAKFINIVLSGSGPGLFFMAFGAIVLLAGLYSGRTNAVKVEAIVAPEKIQAKDVLLEVLPKTHEHSQYIKGLTPGDSNFLRFKYEYKTLPCEVPTFPFELPTFPSEPPTPVK